MGRWFQRRLAGEGPRVERARVRLATWGTPALALSWLPVVGDVLVLAAGLVGVARVALPRLRHAGQGGRYLFLALSVAEVGRLTR